MATARRTPGAERAGSVATAVEDEPRRAGGHGDAGWDLGGIQHERRRDRQMIELLSELRVALPGVQILFAFLLTVPFSARYDELSVFQRDVYYVTLVATALSTACLIAPSAAHRLRFHQGDRTWLIESGNTLTIAGLAFLAAAMSGAVLLITDVIFDGPRVWAYPAMVCVVILGLWFVRPLLRRMRGGSAGD